RLTVLPPNMTIPRCAGFWKATSMPPDCERLVFGMRAHPDGAVLPAGTDDLEELIGFRAAEANHEPNRRRQRRLDAAFTAHTEAAQTL
ncbi:hypothetical protein AN933_22780, partial [Mycobacterium intracellulare subsp. chimaera]